VALLQTPPSGALFGEDAGCQPKVGFLPTATVST
jgi:hypothetical protein